MRSVWVLLNVFAAVIIIAPPILVIGWLDTKKQITNKLVRFWGRWILWATGVHYEIYGLNKLKNKNQYVFMCNHESALDIILGIACLPFNFVFLAKKELFSIPVFGWAMNAAGMIKIDRGNPEKAKHSVNTASETLKNSNFSTLLYPEGTRSSKGELMPFKKGGFILAIQSRLPLVPLTLIGTGKVLPKGKIFIKPGDVKIIIDEPFCTELLQVKDKNNLLKLCRDSIQMNLNKYNDEEVVSGDLSAA